jgi:hypothetical protein
MHDMMYIFNCNWVDTRWQQYSTHLVDTRWQQYITHLVDTRWQQYITHLHTNSSAFVGLVVSMLPSGTQVSGFKRGRSRRIFRAKISSTCLPSEGSKAVRPMLQLCGMLKPLQFPWKSHYRLNLIGHFSPIIPPFAYRGPSRRLTWSPSGDDREN